jgi:hypothetical protein
MTNENNVTINTINNFAERVNTLCIEHETWQKTVFASANAGLYDLLAQVYELYLSAKVGNGVSEQKYDWLIKQVAQRNIPHSKNPTFLQLVTKLVFADSATDSRRVNSYARVLACAAEADIGDSSQIFNYISSQGGIEEIRASMSKNTKTMKQRATEGASRAQSANNIAVVETDELAQYAAKASGKFVVLLGVMNARGQVEVKHKVFGSDVECDEVTSNTVINGALSNMYSNEANKAQKTKQREEDEKKATSINDIPSTSNAPSTDVKAAAWEHS